MSGKLYIVATPIGNLGDITLRALETLKAVDFILCEDTRVTKKLLDHYEINKSTISYHQHSPESKSREIIKLLSEGKNLALVTDAGTPGISDPGGILVSVIARSERSEGRGNPKVRSAKYVGSKNEGITTVAPSGLPRNDNITPIPGACAAITALSISGFPTDKFTFLGFPPHKNKRQKFFKEAMAIENTVVFYESGHRIKKCLTELQGLLDSKRQLVVCRELTKKFETIYRGNIEEIINNMTDERGEFVVVIN